MPDNGMLLVYHRQVERKRHIGNDIVNIIFYECDLCHIPNFKPSMMKTRFTRILLH
jgi:hypothetical protein